MTASDAIAAEWSRADLRAAIQASDRAFVSDSGAVRALVVERALELEPAHDDLFDAWATLGELAAQKHCSPTLVSMTLDHAVAALRAGGARWIIAARAALFEAFTRARVEATELSALRAWEFPHCAVPIGEGTLAVAAGRPCDDAEELDAWAGRVAQGAALRGARRVLVAGPMAAKRALSDALAVIGVDAADAAWEAAAPPAGPRQDGSRT